MRMFVDAGAGAIYLHRDSVDFRKSINGLVMLVEQEMELSPFAPALFVFCSKNRDWIKVLYWEGLPHERSECFGYQSGILLVVQAPGEGEVQMATQPFRPANDAQ